MNNLEKLIATGEAAYGKNWQSPISRALGLSDRTIRNFVSGASFAPSDLSIRLISALEFEIEKFKSAIEIIESDKIAGDDVSINMIVDIVDQYNYSDEQHRQATIDAVNNSVYATTYLSDLNSLAQRCAVIPVKK